MTAREIADLVGGELVGNGDLEITSVAALSEAGPQQLTFAEKSVDTLGLASCVLVTRDTRSDAERTLIKVDNPKLAFAIAARILHPSQSPPKGQHSSAVIAASAVIGEEVSVGPFAVIGERSNVGRGSTVYDGGKIGDDVVIGENCVLHCNVTIGNGCVIGNNVVLYSGVVIGTPGFGYVKDRGGEYVAFPQLGSVVIEDNVEIGANSCIDRGALGDTRIGAGTKIDNLVQIAHNVQIGKRVIIAAQTGISGSTVIEDDCVIGGQVGMGDHATVKSGAIIGSQAGVLPGKIVRPGVWWGTPVQPLEEYKRQNARIKGLERLKEEVASLRKAIFDARR